MRVAVGCVPETHTTSDKRRCSTRRWRSSPRHRLPRKRLDPPPAGCASSSRTSTILAISTNWCSPSVYPRTSSRSTAVFLRVPTLKQTCVGSGSRRTLGGTPSQRPMLSPEIFPDVTAAAYGRWATSMSLEPLNRTVREMWTSCEAEPISQRFLKHQKLHPQPPTPAP